MDCMECADCGRGLDGHMYVRVGAFLHGRDVCASESVSRRFCLACALTRGYRFDSFDHSHDDKQRALYIA